ncbi:MAG TPA: BREX protein BrxB domain-containing protein [Pirellulales bacterium]|nr:BREX protein BrxB domain-containing protein [Pirellulales bacterium]
MSSLDSTFEELVSLLGKPEALDPAKSDPVFYFVHDPQQTLEVKRSIPRWIARLRQDGHQVQTVSLARLLWDAIDGSGRWDDWLDSEADYAPEEINDAVRDVLRGEHGLVAAVAPYVTGPAAGKVLFLTDAALVHPYFRLRTLESALHDRFETPTVLFYPGSRAGQFGLQFLGFYPEDGNYRSTLLGGNV